MVDREREVEELRGLADQNGAKMALLYGRRRVGKTFLLERAWEDRRLFYFLAADSTLDWNRRELLRELQKWSGDEIVPEDYPSWRTLFRLLVSYADAEPLVVVLDEFQYLLGHEEGVASQLNAIWDREVGAQNVTLVLCGSEVGTMESLAAADSPLYGRLNWRHRLRAFDYWNASQMTPNRPRREQAYIYGIFGGTPRYLAAIEEGESLGEAVVRTLLSPRGEVHLQLENLIAQERGIREPAIYRSVLAAVASGRTDTNEVAQGAGLGDHPATARRALETLESLGLIVRERNFDAGRRAVWKNRIADNAVGFWYRFVEPNRSQLEIGDPTRVWEARVAPFLDDYMGKAFEGVAGEAFVRHHEHWGFAAPVEWSRWEGQDRNRRSIELDIVARLDDGRLLTGEVKWSSQPIDYDVHLHLARNLEDLANSGHKWAHDALDPDGSAGHVYVSAAGFTDHFVQRAEEEAIVLLTLDDLFD